MRAPYTSRGMGTRTTKSSRSAASATGGRTTVTATRSIARKPKGTPSGGQFKGTVHGEAEGAVIAGLPPLDDEEAMARMVKSAVYYESRSPLNRDEIFQESALNYLEARDRLQTAIANGEHVEPVRELSGYIQRIVKNVAFATGGKIRYEDEVATNQWKGRCAELSDELRRPLNATEEDALAAEVREGFPTGRRPIEGFHRNDSKGRATKVRTVPLHAGEEGRSLSDTIAAPTQLADEGDFAPGSIGAMVTDLLESGGRPNQARAKAFAWGAMAEASGAPMAEVASLSELRAARIRNEVQQAGGAGALVDRWRDESISESERKALFAPFNDKLTYSEQSDVADLIERSAPWGDRLWDAAITSATRQRSHD